MATDRLAVQIQANIELTRVFRQADPKFVALLNEIRHGLVTPDTARVLAQCSTQQLQVPAGIEPTRLYPLNRDVGMRVVHTHACVIVVFV